MAALFQGTRKLKAKTHRYSEMVTSLTWPLDICSWDLFDIVDDVIADQRGVKMGKSEEKKRNAW